MPSNRISLEPAVLKVGNTKDEDVLLGSRCTECERYFFPHRKRCARCAEPTTEPVELSREGILDSYSLMTRKPKYCRVDPPYILGEVSIPEGIVIYAVIHITDPEALEMGQPVKLDTVKIDENETGSSVIAYGFAPVG